MTIEKIALKATIKPIDGETASVIAAGQDGTFYRVDFKGVDAWRGAMDYARERFTGVDYEMPGALIWFGKVEQHPVDRRLDGRCWKLSFKRGHELLTLTSEMRDILQGWIDKIDGKPSRELETIEATGNFGLQKISQ